MTDDRIKEEYPIGLKMVVPPELLDGFSMGNKIAFSGFYAGFRAAERLAKIEVLKDVYMYVAEMKDGVYSRDEYDIYDRVQLLVANMLSDLKGEQ